MYLLIFFIKIFVDYITGNKILCLNAGNKIPIFIDIQSQFILIDSNFSGVSDFSCFIVSRSTK